MESTKNALAPVEFIVSVVGGFVLILLALSAPLIAFGSGSFLGLGDPVVCLETPANAVAITAQSTNAAHVAGLPPGGSSYPEQINLCQNDPTTWQRSLQALVQAPEFFFFLGFLFITWRLIRYTRRSGFFVPDTALGIGRLGLYLLLGELVVATVRTTASTVLVGTLADPVDTVFNGWTAFFHLSWAVIFAGFGLLTISRVMAQAVPMRAELDATV